MDFSIKDVFEELTLRVAYGPMQLRFLLQPTMAILLGIRDGRKDAREGLPPFIWTMVTKAGSRAAPRLSKAAASSGRAVTTAS